MYWELGFLVLVVVIFLGAFYLLRWGLFVDKHPEKDSLKFSNPEGGGV